MQHLVESLRAASHGRRSDRQSGDLPTSNLALAICPGVLRDVTVLAVV